MYIDQNSTETILNHKIFLMRIILSVIPVQFMVIINITQNDDLNQIYNLLTFTVKGNTSVIKNAQKYFSKTTQF